MRQLDDDDKWAAHNDPYMAPSTSIANRRSFELTDLEFSQRADSKTSLRNGLKFCLFYFACTRQVATPARYKSANRALNKIAIITARRCSQTVGRASLAGHTDSRQGRMSTTTATITKTTDALTLIARVRWSTKDFVTHVVRWWHF